MGNLYLQGEAFNGGRIRNPPSMILENYTQCIQDYINLIFGVTDLGILLMPISLKCLMNSQKLV